MTALEALTRAMRAQAARECELLSAKTLLATANATLLVAGTIAGKNADERDANLRASTGDERAEVDELTRAVIFARCDAEIARLEYDATLRVAP